MNHLSRKRSVYASDFDSRLDRFQEDSVSLCYSATLLLATDFLATFSSRFRVDGACFRVRKNEKSRWPVWDSSRSRIHW